MEESKRQQDMYLVFRILVYVLVLVEIFEYAFSTDLVNSWTPVLGTFHEKFHKIYLWMPGNLVHSKIWTLVMIGVSSIGTRAKKQMDLDVHKRITLPLAFGLLFIALSVVFFSYHIDVYMVGMSLNMILYIALSIAGTLFIHAALDCISKIIKGHFLKDRFNLENESFMQTTELHDTPYSVNIPMRFYYKGKFRKGWINIDNPFRGTFVVGTPGSGKSFSVIDPYIRQHSAKGFSMVVYDYKFPTLATELYYHYLKNKKLQKLPPNCSFNIVNFIDVEYSRRVNPIQLKYIDNLAAASETAETLLESLQKGKKEGGGGSDQFFQTSAVNFLAACIYFFVTYEKRPYNAKRQPLYYKEYFSPAHNSNVPDFSKTYSDPACTVEEEAAYWLGKYSDMPHILSFLNQDYKTIFEVLTTNNEVSPLLGPFKTAFQNKAMEQLEGMIGTLRVQISRIATKESYWIFHRDGDEFDLQVTNRQHPAYLVIANDPEKESITGALNALILNRLVTRVNQGLGKNLPVSIIVDEIPTLYFHKIDRLIGTARSNKVAVTMGFQELPQLESDYGKTGMQKIITTVGNVISGSARNKETLEWLANDIFGKTVQLKRGMTVDEGKTSYNFNENMDSMVQPSKIADMSTGWLCGQTARDFTKTKTGWRDSMDIQESAEFKTTKFFCKTDFDMAELDQEKAHYVPIPKLHNYGTKQEVEKMLYQNFYQVDKDVEALIEEVVQKYYAK